MREEPGPLGPTAWNVSGSLARQLFSNHLKKACEKNSQPLVLRAFNGPGEVPWERRGWEKDLD